MWRKWRNNEKIKKSVLIWLMAGNGSYLKAALSSSSMCRQPVYCGTWLMWLMCINIGNITNGYRPSCMCGEQPLCQRNLCGNKRIVYRNSINGSLCVSMTTKRKIMASNDIICGGNMKSYQQWKKSCNLCVWLNIQYKMANVCININDQ